MNGSYYQGFACSRHKKSIFLIISSQKQRPLDNNADLGQWVLKCFSSKRHCLCISGIGDFRRTVSKDQYVSVRLRAKGKGIFLETLEQPSFSKYPVPGLYFSQVTMQPPSLSLGIRSQSSAVLFVNLCSHIQYFCGWLPVF